MDQIDLTQVVSYIQQVEVIPVAIVVLSLGVMVTLLRRPKSPELPPEIARVPALLGKIDKLEREFGELRREVLRERLTKATAGESQESPLQSSVEEVSTLGDGEGVPAQEILPPAVAASPVLPVSEAEQPAPLAEKLAKSKSSFFSKIAALFSTSKQQVDKALLDELEMTLISADLGPKLTQEIIAEVQQQATAGADAEFVCGIARQKLTAVLEAPYQGAQAGSLSLKREGSVPKVFLIVGVNGVGKTTSVAKLGKSFSDQGAKVLFVAADTFRAGAVDQLKVWGERLAIPVVAGADGAKPQSVIFDGMQQAAQGEFDVVLIDTAGRLHTKSSLMQELEGVRNVIKRHVPDAPHHTWLVVDGSTGTNALSQAKEFHEATPLTGIIVTKLDGTPKGGIVAAISAELGIPVRWIGVGEKPQDLRPFNPAEFAAAIA